MEITESDIWNEKCLNGVRAVIRQVLSSKLIEREYDLWIEAEEVLLAVLEHAWAKRGQFEGKSQVSTWVYRIAINLAINHADYLLRRARMTGPSLNDVDDWEPERLCQQRSPNWHDQPDQAIIEQELFSRLWQEVKRLKDIYRQVWVLDREGLSYKEIAVTLGITENCVRSRLSRARQTLAEALLIEEVIE